MENEEDFVKLSELKSDYSGHDTREVREWEHIQISGDKDFGARLYWSAFKDSSGFEAFMLEDVADCGEYQLVTVVIQVSAMFDGVRHMYFNSGVEDMGYLFYPDTQTLIKGLELIRELELKYCWDCDK